MSKRVAVVGAGACGLLATKSCLEAGLTPVCYERSEDIGGLWNYHKTPRPDRSCVMKTTVANISKEMMSFSDFPYPDDYPNYCHNTRTLAYLRLYAHRFNLGPHVQLQHEVVSIRKCEDFAESGRWSVLVKDLKTGQELTEVFDAVMVCSGHDTDKNIPDIPGRDIFKVSF